MINGERFSEAVSAALKREKGLHGSVGTQNEKLIHAALKNYYSTGSDEQEIRIGDFFADAVCEDGIFEIQTRQLYKLKDKLKTFLEYSRVTVVYPMAGVLRTIYVNSESGEIVKETTPRRMNSLLKAFEEIYSIRDFLNESGLRIIIARLNIQKRVYFSGKEIPNILSKYERKKCRIEKVPLDFCEEIVLESKSDYMRFMPENLPEHFTKKEFSEAVRESRSSLRLELLRTVGIIEKTGKKGKSYLYTRSL